MNKIKKLICGLLAICMIVTGITMIPQTVQAADDDFVIEDGVLIEYKGSGGKVVIPDGVTEIADYVFYYNDTITSITVPESVTKCGSRCFGGCTSLKEITFKNSEMVLDWDCITQSYDLEQGAFCAGDYWEYSLAEVKPMVQTLTIKGYSGSTAQTLAKSLVKYPWGNLTVKFVNLKNKKSTTYGVPTTLSIKKGKTSNKCKVSIDSNAFGSVPKITYKSSNEKVATISSAGKITAKKKGTTTITVTITWKDSGMSWKKTAKTKVTVK
jgi:hypothetical protein